jgi:hypothetical protein
MNLNIHMLLAWLAALLAWQTAAAQPAPAAAQAAPKPPASGVDWHYASPITGYQGYRNTPIDAWSASNQTVKEIGGWRAYAKEAAADKPQTSAPAAQPQTSAPATQSPGTQTPAPMHKPHGGH